MRRSRFTHCLPAWIACCAILLAAFAPAAHADLTTIGSSMAGMQICAGTAPALDNPVPAPSIPLEKAVHVQHCPFCTAAALDALPSTAFRLPGAGSRPPAPAIAAQSRAPPTAPNLRSDTRLDAE